jgi:hypothetical protein
MRKTFLNNKILSLITASLVLVLIVLATLVFLAIPGASTRHITVMYEETQAYIERNQTGFDDIMTTGFLEARNCQHQHQACLSKFPAESEKALIACQELNVCGFTNQATIYKNLFATEDLRDFPSTYFIHLADDQIEKLFLSGDYEISTARTERENKVLDLLRQQGPSFEGLAVRDHYLNDLYSDAEVIVPVVKDGQVIGAVVRLYGDLKLSF